MASKRVKLVLRRIDGDRLRPEVKDLEAFVNGKMSTDPRWELDHVSLVKFNSGAGGRNYLLAAMTLFKP